jgi:Generalcontrol nonderepressible 1 (Gcn1) N-terminal
LSKFITVLKLEANKPGIAPSNAFVLVEWCSVILQSFAQYGASSEQGLKTVLEVLAADAAVLDLCLGGGVRQSIRYSTLVVTRRGLRKLFKEATKPVEDGQEERQDVVKAVVEAFTAKGAPGGMRNALLLGIVGGVCARLPIAIEKLDACKKDVHAFYVRDIIGSRTPIPPHIAEGLHDFFAEFTSLEDIQKEIMPSMEKALLRSPEIVLNGVIENFVEALPVKADLSQILLGNLLKGLLSNVKSSNPAIRLGALSTFQKVTTRCRDDAVIAKIADEILEPLRSGKISVVDQRTLHAQMLSALPGSKTLAKKIPAGLVPVVAKEPNEAAMGAVLEALQKHVGFGLVNDVDVEKPVVEAFAKGILDKRPAIKRLWYLRLGDIIWNMKDEDVRAHASKIEPFYYELFQKMYDSWQEIVDNPASQAGVQSVGYVITSIALKRFPLFQSERMKAAVAKCQLCASSLVADPKPSFLLSVKIFTKLTVEEDQIWAIRSLAAVSKSITAKNAESGFVDAWVYAYLFLICSATSTPKVRKVATETLSQLYVKKPELMFKIFIHGVWEWRRFYEGNYPPSISAGLAAVQAKTGMEYIHLAIKAICLPREEVERLGGHLDEDLVEHQVGEMLVLCRHEIMPGVSWIELCQRAGVDPGTFATKHAARLTFQVRLMANLAGRVSLSSFSK